MDKQLFKQTENMIYKYYQKDKLIKSLNAKLKLLENQIEAIQNDLRICNINIEPSMNPISYEECVKTSSNRTSYAEKEVMRITEFKIKRMIEKELEKQKIFEQIDNIEKDALEIEWKIDDFTDELKRLLELKYKKRFNDNKIGEEMHLSQSQITKIKWKLIKHIACWDQWNSI